MGGSIDLGSIWSDLGSGTINSCFSMGKNGFLGITKNNHASVCQVNVHYYFLKHSKSNLLHPNATFNGIPVMGISKAAQNNWTHPSKVNIEQATAICLKKKFVKNLENIFVLEKEP